MDKPTVSPRRFVEILNERLTRHPLYREGMHVYAIPPHSEHPHSLVCVGPRGPNASARRSRPSCAASATSSPTSHGTGAAQPRPRAHRAR
jgi:hypothetical protein